MKMLVTKQFAKVAKCLPRTVIVVQIMETWTSARNFVTTQLAARTLLISAMRGVRSSVLVPKLSTRLGKAEVLTLSYTEDRCLSFCWITKGCMKRLATKQFATQITKWCRQWKQSVVIRVNIVVQTGETWTNANNSVTRQLAALTLLISTILGVESTVLAPQLGTRNGNTELFTLSSMNDR